MALESKSIWLHNLNNDYVHFNRALTHVWCPLTIDDDQGLFKAEGSDRPLEAPGLLVHLQALEAAVAGAAGDAGVRAREAAHRAQLPRRQPRLGHLGRGCLVVGMCMMDVCT